MKKIGFLLLAVIIVLGYWYIQQERNIIADAVRFKEQFPEVSDNNLFIYTTTDKMIILLEKGTGILFIGSHQDIWSQAVAPIIDNISKENNLDQIYYYDISKIQDNTIKYQKIVSLLTDILPIDDKGQKIIPYPALISFKNGIILGNHFIKHDDRAKVVELTTREIEDYTNNYIQVIRKISE